MVNNFGQHATTTPVAISHAGTPHICVDEAEFANIPVASMASHASVASLPVAVSVPVLMSPRQRHMQQGPESGSLP